MERKIIKTVQGQMATYGAGVRLVRVLGHETVLDFDPFLMLDSFDSRNPDDYTAGFPFHPHRGIETITYLIEGEMEHQDSLGNRGTIHGGESQWMTAGSGIMHQEMPMAGPRMLGLQIWLNLPQEDKMTAPRYFDIKDEMIKKVEDENAVVRVVSGEYQGQRGVSTNHIQAGIYDITLKPGKKISIPTKEGETVFIFTIEGEAASGGTNIPEKTAALFGDGDSVSLEAPEGREARVIFLSGKPLREPVAWGGPVVMNTGEEIREAFLELRNDSFIKHAPVA